MAQRVFSTAGDQAGVNAAASKDISFTVMAGSDALNWSKTSLKQSEWDRVWRECPWSTAFQSSTFFDVWTRHYGDSWSPLLVLGWRGDGSLAGVMPLAAKAGLIVGVGAHQAEYQGWISSEAEALDFLRGALAALTKHAPHHELRLQYLPAGVPSAVVEWLGRHGRAMLLPRRTQHLSTDHAKIDAVLRKKSNKSKLNRLQRLGKVQFRKLTPDVLLAELDRIVAMYDFRQGALHDVCPFSDDDRKRSFHVDWLRTSPQQLQATGLYVDDRLISALLLVRSKSEAHLAISAFCPDYASHSPSKINVYLAARSLCDEGVAVLDLTPGDDPWKARFGNEERTVWELTVCATEAAAHVQRLRGAIERVAHRALAFAGLSADRLETSVRLLGDTWRMKRGIGRRSYSQHMFDISGLALIDRPSAPVSVNCLRDLLNLSAKTGRDARAAFLSDALLRIERGDRCFIAFDQTRREHCFGWVRAQDNVETAVFEGFLLSQPAHLQTAAVCLDAMARDVIRVRPNAGFALLNLLPGQEILRAAATEIAVRRPTSVTIALPA